MDGYDRKQNCMVDIAAWVGKISKVKGGGGDNRMKKMQAVNLPSPTTVNVFMQSLSKKLQRESVCIMKNKAQRPLYHRSVCHHDNLI